MRGIRDCHNEYKKSNTTIAKKQPPKCKRGGPLRLLSRMEVPNTSRVCIYMLTFESSDISETSIRLASYHISQTYRGVVICQT